MVVAYVICYIVCEIIPLSWFVIQKYFELDPLSKDLMFKKMSEIFRGHKSDLRKNYYDIFNTDEERMKNCPPKIGKNDWEEFIRYESTPEAKEKRKKGKQNRSKLEYCHHSGRKSHARITQEMVRVFTMFSLHTDSRN
jgi:hypothetical protein